MFNQLTYYRHWFFFALNLLIHIYKCHVRCFSILLSVFFSLKCHKTRSDSPFRLVVRNFVFIPPITSRELQRELFRSIWQWSTDRLTPATVVAFNLPSLYGPRSVTSSYLLFTSTRRVCFRTWLLAKLVSVMKVVNENIDGYGFSPHPSHASRYAVRKKIFCLVYQFVASQRTFSQALGDHHYA